MIDSGSASGSPRPAAGRSYRGSTPHPGPSRGSESSSCSPVARRRTPSNKSFDTRTPIASRASGPSHADEPLAHGDGRGRDEREVQGRTRVRRPTWSRCSRTWASRSSTWPSSTATAIPRTPARYAWPKCRRCSTNAAGSRTTRSPVPPRRGGQHPPRPVRRRKRPGHWEYLFPRPVYWTMNRARPAIRRGTGPIRAGLSRRRRGHAGTP